MTPLHDVGAQEHGWEGTEQNSHSLHKTMGKHMMICSSTSSSQEDVQFGPIVISTSDRTPGAGGALGVTLQPSVASADCDNKHYSH